MSAKKLSNGEKKVISAYNGNAKETAELCGLAAAYVRKLLTLYYVQDAIQAREEKENANGKNPLIADRSERQAFWTSVMKGEPQTVELAEKLDEKGKPIVDDDGKPVMVEIKKVAAMSHRLEAAKLLGKSNADFIERKEITGPGGGPVEFKQKFATIEEVEEEMKRRGLPVDKM